MVQRDVRGNVAGESEPTAPALGGRGNFDMGIEGARDYKSLLAGGVAREHPGAPVPYSGAGGVAADIYGAPSGTVPDTAEDIVEQYSVPQGIHRDPMAAWINDGSVPAGATGYAGFNVRPQGSSTPGRSDNEFRTIFDYDPNAGYDMSDYPRP